MTSNTLSGLVVLGFLATPTVTLAGSVTPFLFSVDGAQEVPPIVTAATGGCYAVLDEPASQLNITCAHNVIDATAAHIHDGALGIAGPIVFDLGDPSISPFSASWSGLSAAEVADLVAGNLYVNIHSSIHPAGEVRGQIMEPVTLRYSASLDEAESVPPTGSDATGECAATFDVPSAMLTVDCAHTLPTPTAAHVHRGAAGTTGPIVFELGDPTSPFSMSFIPAPQDLAELAARLFYVNIHSDAFPAGEIRGQLTSDQIFADGFESGDTAGWSGAVP